jgi:hypothetical protein
MTRVLPRRPGAWWFAWRRLQPRVGKTDKGVDFLSAQQTDDPGPVVVYKAGEFAKERR